MIDLGLTITPDMRAAIKVALGHMFEELERAFPQKSAGLHAVACASRVCDILNSGFGADFAPMIARELTGTPYALVARAAN
jgi:hypothetical protein